MANIGQIKLVKDFHADLTLESEIAGSFSKRLINFKCRLLNKIIITQYSKDC